MIGLRPFTKKHFKQLIDWIPSESFMIQWSGSSFTYPLTPRQLKHYIRYANEEGATTHAFAVVNEQTEEVIGHISLAYIDYYNKTGRIGRVLLKEEERGKGYCYQMFEKTLTFGFEELQLHRISLGVFDFNVKAIQSYERIGFVREGLMRDVKLVDGQYWNIIEMSMLENEWMNRSQRYDEELADKIN
ncbi:GNAT family N-acetyltransferase [Priestia megaterium]|nr:GNAT family N-acetyltransferase [Priestia megaterium]